MRNRVRERLVTAGRVVAVGGVVALIALVTTLAFPGVIGATETYVVLSGSMAPTIGPGDIVVVRDVPADAIHVGDVVTYREPGAGPSGRVTHRVVGREDTPDGPVFQTKGDANDVADDGTVDPGKVVGEVWFHVPYIGRMTMVVRHPLGTLLFVLLPGLLLVTSGARQLRAVLAGAEDRRSLEVAPGSTDPATGVLRGSFTEDGRVRDLSGERRSRWR